ncbi:unnamed protein product, partial [Boreogadus saida]
LRKSCRLKNLKRHHVRCEDRYQEAQKEIAKRSLIQFTRENCEFVDVTHIVMVL